MTLSEIKSLLSGATGFSNKVVYRAWEVGSAPSLPFICFYFLNNNNFFADNSVYSKSQKFVVELYTANKDTTSEGYVESVLNNLCWTKSESYIDSEKCYQIIYEIEV